MNKPKIALIGLGLIGSSLGHALKKNALAAHISGFAQSSQTRSRAVQLGFVDTVHDSAAAACLGADIIFLNTPLGVIETLVREIMPTLKEGAIITDVGSVKAGIIRDIEPLLEGRIHLVPGHPIAGTEQSGPDAGFAELFEGRWCILTPTPQTSLIAVDVIAKLWRDMGSEVEFMDATHHDLVLAVTSHLPHLIAYNIVNTAAELESDTRHDVIKYSASGFRDFTRLASSDPVMWRDIFLQNKEAVLEILGRFSEDLTALQRAIRRSDGDNLQKIFTQTRSIRKSIIEAGQDVAAPNFGRPNSGYVDFETDDKKT